jgi:hypothetical protein
MASSVKEALDYIQEKFENKANENNGRYKRSSSSRSSSSWPKWNIEEMQNLLNIVRDQAEQVEGNIQFPFAGAQRFLAFDNHTLDRIPRGM